MQTYFFEAISAGDLDKIQSLLSQNSELVHTKDQRGFPPLVLATYNAHKHLIEPLLVFGADIDAQDASGNTALMGVCFKGNLEIANFLIERGADVNKTNNSGGTALTFACTFGQLEIAKVLLKHGANPLQKDNRGASPWDYAKIKGNKALTDLFEEFAHSN